MKQEIKAKVAGSPVTNSIAVDGDGLSISQIRSQINAGSNLQAHLNMEPVDDSTVAYSGDTVVFSTKVKGN